MKTTDQTNVQPIKETNAFYERLLQMREKDPKTFAGISPASKLTLLYYEAGRREFFRLQEMKTKTN